MSSAVLSRNEGYWQAAELPAATVLCLDADPVSRGEMAVHIRAVGGDVLEASTIESALEILISHRTVLTIVSPLFLKIGEDSLFKALRKIDPDAVFILNDDRDATADGFKHRTYDCISRSLTQEEIRRRLSRAIAFATNKRRAFDFRRDSQTSLRNKLEWFVWKDKTRDKDKISAEKTLLRNIKHAVTQGRGLGAVLCRADLLEMSCVRNGDKVEADAHAVDGLLGATNDLRNWFSSLERMVGAFSVAYEPEIFPADVLKDILTGSLQSVEKFRSIKHHTIIPSEITFLGNVIANRDALGLAFREILTNAMKYSPENSEIQILSFSDAETVSFIVINEVIPMTGGTTGIPEQMQQLVFEPFYRMNNSFDDRFNDEELGMGIGLTVVRSALSQFQADISLFETTNHAAPVGHDNVIAVEISLRRTGQATRLLEDKEEENSTGVELW